MDTNEEYESEHKLLIIIHSLRLRTKTSNNSRERSFCPFEKLRWLRKRQLFDSSHPDVKTFSSILHYRQSLCCLLQTSKRWLASQKDANVSQTFLNSLSITSQLEKLLQTSNCLSLHFIVARHRKVAASLGFFLNKFKLLSHIE